MSITTAPSGGCRRELLAAARTVTAREGLRGLTHRAVDREAALALGTCSAYLRTSRALRTALAQDVVAELSADVEEVAARLGATTPGRAEAVRLTRELFQRWLRERTTYLVAAELSLAAVRDADLAALLASWRSRLAAVVEQLIARSRPPVGPSPRAASDVADMLVAAAHGVLSAALALPEAEREEALTTWLGLLLDAVALDPTGLPSTTRTARETPGLG